MNYLLFAVTFFPISLMPGINMTYAMSIGMILGYVRALPMMAGQLASLAFVGICCMLGVGAVLAHYSFAFKVLNVIAGLFIEFCSLSIYALGGAILKKFLQTHLRLLEIFTAVVICTIGILMMLR